MRATFDQTGLLGGVDLGQFGPDLRLTEAAELTAPSLRAGNPMGIGPGRAGSERRRRSGSMIVQSESLSGL